MSISDNISKIKLQLPEDVTLIAVSKTKSSEEILDAYNAGQRDFGENRVQELLPKYEALPKDIRWHLIGHLQTNKVKYVVPFVHLIHSIDSENLLEEINKQAGKINRGISILLQIHIAHEESKFGFSTEEADKVIQLCRNGKFKNVRIDGLMGMATNTEDQTQVRTEFRGLKHFFDQVRQPETLNPKLVTLSMGMSSDWEIAIQEGSTMVRIGSSIFGSR